MVADRNPIVNMGEEWAKCLATNHAPRNDSLSHYPG